MRLAPWGVGLGPWGVSRGHTVGRQGHACVAGLVARVWPVRRTKRVPSLWRVANKARERRERERLAERQNV